jgi:hypothetical protein
MRIINFRNLLKLIIILIFFSFILGFYFNENSAGGGPGDYNHIANNYNLIFSNDYSEIDWSKYRSTRFPLHYFIINSYLPYNLNLLKLNIFFLSVLSFIIFYLVLLEKKKLYKDKISRLNLLLLSSILLLSPYFRTSAFWMLEENIGFFFLLISFFLILRGINNNNQNYIYFGIFFSYLSFYSSQNLLIFIIANFLYLFQIYKNDQNKILIIIFINIIFILPLFIFFDQFKLIMGNTLSSRLMVNNLINYSNIISIFSILSIYCVPFLFLEKKYGIFKYKFVVKYILFCFFSLIFFFLIFKNISYEFLSGGSIKKLIYLFPLSNEIKSYLFILSGWFGFLLFFYLAQKYKYLYFFIFFYASAFLITDYTFQEYFDPVFLFFFFFYCKSLNNIEIKRLSIVCVYFALFLFSAIIYYSRII